jgi:ABC-2 type transport system ATP-binding protein
MIEVQNLSFAFRNHRVLHRINFQIPRHAIAGLIGPNGSGKTTLFRNLCGFLVPPEGHVRLDGISLVDHPLEARKRMGYMPEVPYLHKEMWVAEYLDFVASLKGVRGHPWQKQKNQLLETCGLKHLQYKITGSLSKGNRQRVALAQALIGSPQVLLLDEPTSALDPSQAEEMRNLIRSLSQGTTVLMSSHILSEIETLCDTILFIHQGKIVYEGPRSQIQGASSELRTELILRFAAPCNPFVKALKSLSGVEGTSDPNPSSLEISLKISNSQKFYPELFQCAREQEWPLREIIAKQTQLQWLFHQVIP